MNSSQLVVIVAVAAWIEERDEKRRWEPTKSVNRQNEKRKLKKRKQDRKKNLLPAVKQQQDKTRRLSMKVKLTIGKKENSSVKQMTLNC